MRKRFLTLNKTLDEETSFMLYEPGERNTTVEAQRDRIQGMLQSGRSIIYVAEEHDTLVGYIAGLGSDIQRTKHVLYIVIGILQDYAGQGIGTQLFNELLDWANEKDIVRLELTVMAHNERAIALYRKIGFTIEGVKKCSILVKEQYIDEYMMSRLLHDGQGTVEGD
ncbi:GNAT family N-acetyltransferase [Paenibacillus profundus]|uniref:GNAT family N-acetyltransferase n=1 Tax=Paenibacillus profundus TaxID=1173085 RepID=A0ABS8YGK1_9BACL|nr:GNAT family N-acetyltransferase [Paenibacillus profundus]MCE5171110.1 GNAT family N-acetyltransferase [Paenibacillus profundus]